MYTHAKFKFCGIFGRVSFAVRLYGTCYALGKDRRSSNDALSGVDGRKPSLPRNNTFSRGFLAHVFANLESVALHYAENLNVFSLAYKSP